MVISLDSDLSLWQFELLLCLYSDLRAELPVPDSVLSDFTVSDMYPASPYSFTDDESTTDAEDLRQIYEMSWYYYLSDVTLKRIEAQILNTFYNVPGSQWDISHVARLSRLATDFESQIDNW